MYRLFLPVVMSFLLLLRPTGAADSPAAETCVLPLALHHSVGDWELAIAHPAAGRDCGRDLIATRAMLERAAALLACGDPRSEIASVNRLAGSRSGRLGRPTYDLVLRSLVWKDRTKGAVDPLAGPLKRIWLGHDPLPIVERDPGPESGAATSACRLACRAHRVVTDRPGPWPTSAQVDSALALVHQGGTYFVDLGVLLRDPGMELDLDPVLDGVLVDRALDSLTAAGHGGLRLRVGGVWRCDNQGGVWSLPLAGPDGSLLGNVALSGQALAAVEPQPCLRLAGQALNGLLDPRDGRPLEALASWALAPSGEEARVWALALAVLGPEEGLALLAAEARVEGACCRPDGAGGFELWTTPGFPVPGIVALPREPATR